MRKLLTFCVAVAGLALAGSTAWATRVYHVPESTVVRACAGHDTGTANGQFGCSRCDGGVCRDYNCSNGSNGVAKGCRETVIDLKARPGGRKGPTHGTGVGAVGVASPGRTKVHPINVEAPNKPGSVGATDYGHGGGNTNHGRNR